MNKDIFSFGQQQGGTLVTQLRASLESHLPAAAPMSRSTAREFINSASMESLSDSVYQDLRSSVDNLKVTLESAIKDLNLSREHEQVNNNQRRAGIMAAVLAQDLRAAGTRTFQQPSLESRDGVKTELSPASGGVKHDRRLMVSTEQYSEQENAAMTSYSVAWNMVSSRQDKFNEAFWPTIVVDPNKFGYEITMPLVQVYNEISRGTDGTSTKANFGRTPIVKALIEPKILQTDTTRLIPIVRANNANVFVPAATIPVINLSYEGNTYPTAPIAFPCNGIDVLGISQTDELLKTGFMDSTDALDPKVNLDALYVKVGTDVIKFGNLENLAMSAFTNAQQGLNQRANLNFTTKMLVVNQFTTQYDGSTSTVLAPITSVKAFVELQVDVYGHIDLQTARLHMAQPTISVSRVKDANGNVLDTSTGTGQTLAAIFNGATVLGFDLEARRINANRRERGQLIDFTTYRQLYEIPVLSPITVLRPMSDGRSDTEASDLNALTIATHVRVNNMGVAQLLKTQSALRSFVTVNGAVTANGTVDNLDPEIMGVSRMILSPYYEEQNINVLTRVDSQKSFERAADTQALMVNVLRDMAYRGYRDSGFQAAQIGIYGNNSQPPMVKIGTDPVIARYLQVAGDFRTLGNEFPVEVVDTLNINMRGKIVMVFQTQGDNSGNDPLGFGNMLWRPEIVTVLPLHRGGANSKELTAQPSVRFICKTPIMMVVNVTGLSDVMTQKVTVNYFQVP